MKLPWRVAHKLLGRTVMEIDCRGCMAEQHHLVRVGEIVEVDDQRIILNAPDAQPMIIAKCRTIQSRRDMPDEFFTCAIADGDFQELPSGAFGQHLGYIWRH